jgi:hypothetical protein
MYMTSTTWVVLGIALIGWAANTIFFIRKTERDRLKFEAEMDKRVTIIDKSLENLQKDFNLHEMNNEKQFEKYHRELREDMDKVFSKIDAIKDLIMKINRENHAGSEG